MNLYLLYSQLKEKSYGKNLIQLIKFGMIGVTGTIVDFGFLNLFVLYFKMDVFLSAAISFILAASNNFVWNRAWTFKEESKDKKIQSLYVKYIIIATIGLIINLLILRIFLPYFGKLFALDINSPLVLNLSKIVATIIVMLWNFIGSKKWVFN